MIALIGLSVTGIPFLALMGAVAALAVLSGRGPVSLAALSTAMCVLLVIDPGLGPDFGFALSVCATAGIVVTARPLTRVLEHLMPTVLAIVLAGQVPDRRGTKRTDLAFGD